MVIPNDVFNFFGGFQKPPTNKEQISGMEALGDVVEETDTVADTPPMDSTDENPDEDQVEETPPAEDGSEPPVEDDESPTDDTASDPDGDPLAEDAPDEGDGMDEEQPEPKPEPAAEDPQQALNLRIVISNKLIKLYNAINTAMDKLGNMPNSELKPVKLEELEILKSDVLLINESINKEPNVEHLQFRWGVALKSYHSIIVE